MRRLASEFRAVELPGPVSIASAPAAVKQPLRVVQRACAAAQNAKRRECARLHGMEHEALSI